MSKTQKNEMISLGNKFKNDDFQKLFTLFYNYQEKPFLSLTDSKDFIGIIFEENKSNQFMAINYISSNYLKEIMKISDDGELLISNDFKNDKNLFLMLSSTIKESLKTNKAFINLDNQLVELEFKHGFKNILDKTSKVRKLK